MSRGTCDPRTLKPNLFTPSKELSRWTAYQHFLLYLMEATQRGLMEKFSKGQ
jgi:hypothetical protein